MALMGTFSEQKVKEFRSLLLDRWQLAFRTCGTRDLESISI